MVALGLAPPCLASSLSLLLPVCEGLVSLRGRVAIRRDLRLSWFATCHFRVPANKTGR